MLFRHPYLIAAISILAISANRPVLGQVLILEQAEAKRIARQKGWVVRRATPRRTIELQRIVNGIPLYYTTYNMDAADSLSTDECWPGGSGGLGLTGTGVTLGVWDGGAVHTTHSEFQGRATQMDAPAGYSDHATHVSGTMIAGGTWPGNSEYPAGASKGMSWGASLQCYDWNNDKSEMATAATAGLLVSNHSYGAVNGWIYSDFGAGTGWYWLGDVRVSAFEDFWFGFYSLESANWDQIAYDNAGYLFVVAAGNDRGEGPVSGSEHWYFDPAIGDWALSTAVRSLDGPYDCISHHSIAKNGLTVGAVEDVIAGYAGPGSVTMTSFSCWGPADDGRIKPDIVANGWELFSPVWVEDATEYWTTFSGTSMASPNASGSFGLLIEHFRRTHPDEGNMLAATLKALVIHTADECGTANGPDYEYGWGLVNTLRAAETISTDVSGPLTLTERTLRGGETFGMIITTNGSPSLRATLCWTDPPGTPPPSSLDPPTKMLVNDLDLRIESAGAPQTTYYPWVLNPADPIAPATRGDNDTDNVEQVVVYSPGSNSFFLRVTPNGSLSSGRQDFSLIITGATAIVPDCNANGVPDDQDISGGTSPDCNADDIPDECELGPNDCNENSIPDDCEIADGADNDCNDNGVPDLCEVTGGGDPLDEGFEAGLPPGWTASGIFQVTSQCATAPRCDGVFWAYAGDLATCSYGDNESGELTSPTVRLGYGPSELRFCSRMVTELDYDFVKVRVNGTLMWERSGGDGTWQEEGVDLSDLAGQTVTLAFQFASDGGVSGTLGWQVDNIQVLTDSADCNHNGLPDDCEDVLPVIVLQPTGLTSDLGESAAFTVAATGAALTYQWQKNSADIPGANGPTFTIPSVGRSDLGLYRVQVISPCGTVTSEEVGLSRHYILAVDIEGQGSVMLDPPGGRYENRTTVLLTPMAAPAWRFSQWSGIASGSGASVYVMLEQDESITAHFVPDEPQRYRLTARTVKQVTVTLTPDGGLYEVGTQVRLEAVPHDGWQFVQWAGAVESTDSVVWVVMNSDRLVVVIAAEDPATPSPPEDLDLPDDLDTTLGPEGLCGNCGPGAAPASMLMLLVLPPLARGGRRFRRRG